MLRGQVCRAQREQDRKDAALPGAALRRDGASVQPGELLHQGEPDAAPLVAPAFRAFRAVEALEEVRDVSLGDPHPRVRHPQPGLAFVEIQRHPDAAGEGELERVGDEVEDDLLVHLPIHVDRLGKRRAVHGEGQSCLLHQRAEGAGEIGGERRKVRGLGLRPRAAGFDPAEVEQGVDQLQEPQRVPVHRLEKFAGEDPLRERPRGFGDPEDESEGGPELVADVREERSLRPVELREGLRLLARFFIGSGPAQGGADGRRDQVVEAAVGLVHRQARAGAGHQHGGGQVVAWPCDGKDEGVLGHLRTRPDLQSREARADGDLPRFPRAPHFADRPGGVAARVQLDGLGKAPSGTPCCPTSLATPPSTR